MKRRHTTPRYYARNAAIQAQRRFLRTGKTEAERLDDHREATANVLVLCILAAIYDKYGIGEMRLQRVVDCANEISAKYALEKQVRGEERAKATLGCGGSCRRFCYLRCLPPRRSGRPCSWPPGAMRQTRL